MKATKHVPEPVPVPPITYTLEMSEYEAFVLRDVLSQVYHYPGHHPASAAPVCAAIRDELCAAGVPRKPVPLDGSQYACVNGVSLNLNPNINYPALAASVGVQR